MTSLTRLSSHGRIIGALMMREIMTRYGREGLGFLWLVGEPLIFCLGVLTMWHFIKPPYEHGIKLGPFVMTGYMCLLLLRHLIGATISALQANSGLLYHSKVKPLHIYCTRVILEFAGATSAFIIVYALLLVLKQVSLPSDYLLLYAGWLITLGLGSGLALTFGGLALLSDLFERLVGFLSYALIPISGAFVMTSFLPPAAQKIYLWIPFPHGVEMVRAAIFGEFVETHYNPAYALLWVLIMNLCGIVLITVASKRVEVD